MIQPQYSPQEALDRIKLMMKYDTSKTLNENVQVISEQATLTSTAGSTAIGAGLGAGTGIAMGAGALGGLGTTAGGAALGLGTTLAPSLGAAGATALGASVIGGAAALAIVPLVMWYMDKDNAKPKVARIIQYCTSDATKIAKIKRGNSEAEIRNLSDQLYDAMNGLGTDEEKVYGAFKSLKTASDFCALVNRFNKDYGSQGDLLEWLDGDFDASDEWEQIFRPIRDVVEDTLLNIKDETPVVDANRQSKINLLYCSVKNGVIDNVLSEFNGEKWEEFVTKNAITPAEIETAKKSCTGGKKTDDGGGGSGYKSCTGTYQFGCKSDVIAKVQKCIGVGADGKFGPKTRAALNGKGITTFTDADVDKICQTVAVNNDEFQKQVEPDNVDDVLNS
jgi:hypothetical protein